MPPICMRLKKTSPLTLSSVTRVATDESGGLFLWLYLDKIII